MTTLTLEQKLWLARQFSGKLTIETPARMTFDGWEDGEAIVYWSDNDCNVTDREWLFICHLVESKLDEEAFDNYINMLMVKMKFKFIDADGSEAEDSLFEWYGWGGLCKATDSQRCQALMQVLGEGQTHD